MVPLERLWRTLKRSVPLCRSPALTGQPGLRCLSWAVPPQHTVWKLAGETCPQSCMCCAYRWSAPVLGLGLRSWGCAHDPMVQLAQ